MVCAIVKQISQTRCGQTVGRTAFVISSFERSFSVVLFGAKVLQCHVILTYLFSTEVIPPTKSRYIRAFQWHHN